MGYYIETIVNPHDDDVTTYYIIDSDAAPTGLPIAKCWSVSHADKICEALKAMWAEEITDDK